MEIIVERGDTLWDLAAKHLGDPTKWPQLYEVNHAAIEREAAKVRARQSMRGPHWIFPGTRLLIPQTGTCCQAG